jgi:hypothetical protein
MTTPTCRLLYSANVAHLLAELGIVACSLTYLFNLRNHYNAGQENINSPKLSNSIALTFVSLGTTLLAFAINLFGISKAVMAVRNAVHRVTEAARRVSTSGVKDKGQEGRYSARVVPERVELMMVSDELCKRSVTGS